MLPCESCVKRGMTDECRWDDLVRVPPAQPFASAIEVAALTERLKAVEDHLSKLSESLTEQEGPGAMRSPIKVLAPVVAARIDNDEHTDDHDEQQAAVGALEELALGELVLSTRPPNSTVAFCAEGRSR